MRKQHLIRRLREAHPYRGFRGVYMREWRRFGADSSLKILLFIIAPIICWLFCALYGDGTVKDLPIAVCDKDESALSRTITRSLDATKLMNVVAYVNTYDELSAGVSAGTFYGGVYLPANMEADVKDGRQVQPVIYRNGTNYLVSSFLARDMQTVMRTVNAGLVRSRLRKSGIASLKATALVSPVSVDASNLYNPVFSYQNYLTPGVVFAQLGLIVMLCGAVCFAREREHGTLPRLRHRAQNNVWAALYGKSFPYVFMMTIFTTFLLCVLFPFYNVATIHEAVASWLAIALFFTASWWMGAAVGIIAGQVMFGAAVAIFLGMPAFIFSGWTFPLAAAPLPMIVAVQILPFTHFMPAWFTSARMDCGILSPVNSLLAMTVIASVGYIVSHVMLGWFWKQPHHHKHGAPKSEVYDA